MNTCLAYFDPFDPFDMFPFMLYINGLKTPLKIITFDVLMQMCKALASMVLE